MDLVLQAVKSDLGLVLQTGRYLLGSFFLLAVLVNYIGMIRTQVNWADLLLRLVVGFILIQNYIWFMDLTRDILVGLDQRINPVQDAIVQYAQMSDNMQAQYEANTQKGLIGNFGDLVFGKFTLHNLVINLSFIFYAVVSKIMEVIRYSLVAIIYKIGPILIPLILFQSTSKVLKGWFTQYVAILAWPILWHITLGIAVALSANIMPGEGIEQFAALNFAVCFVLIFTPMIMSGLIAGAGLGSAASLAGALAASKVFQTINRTTQGAVQGTAHMIRRVPYVPQYVQRASTQAKSVGSRLHNFVRDFKTTKSGGKS